MRLYEDVLPNDGALRLALPALPRMIFVVHGAATIADRVFADGEAWHGEEAVTLAPGSDRRHLLAVRARAARMRPTAACRAGRWCRGRSSWHRRRPCRPAISCCAATAWRFRPAAAPSCTGIRARASAACIEGGIRIDTHGASTSYGPGGAWYESGPEPVFAQGARDRATRFIRMMILPRALIGKSSIEYLNAEDKERPKSQSYKGFADAPISFPASAGLIFARANNKQSPGRQAHDRSPPPYRDARSSPAPAPRWRRRRPRRRSPTGSRASAIRIPPSRCSIPSSSGCTSSAPRSSGSPPACAGARGRSGSATGAICCGATFPTTGS